MPMIKNYFVSIALQNQSIDTVKIIEFDAICAYI